MSRRLAAPLAAALLSCLVLAAPSSAQKFCVGVISDGCPDGTVEPTVQAALDAAHAVSGRDRVEVGLGVDDDHPGFTVVAGNQVDVIGVDGPYVFLKAGAPGIVIAEPTAVVSGLTVLSDEGVPSPAIDVAVGTLRDVEVLAAGVDPVVRLGAGTLDHVTFPRAGPGGVGVRAIGPGGVITDSDVFAEVGLESSSDDLVIRRSSFEGRGWASRAAAIRVTGGEVTADDVATYISGDALGTVGVDVAPGAGSARLTLRSATVRGDGQPTLTTGVRASCAGGGSATVTLVDTAILGHDTDLRRAAPNCAMSLDHVRYGTRDAGVGGTFADGPGVTSGPVGPFGTWVDPGFDSPLIDAGSARADADTDVYGLARVVDGDGDGTPVRDIGAVEYQRAAPHAQIDPPDAYLDEPTWFWGEGSWDHDGGDQGRLRYAWTVDGAPVAPADVDDESVTARHTFTTLGQHTVTLTVTDPTGLSDTATATVEVVEEPEGGDDPADGPTPPTPPAGPGTVTTPPLTIVPPHTQAPQPFRPTGVPPVAGKLLDHRLRARHTLRVQIICWLPKVCRGTVVLRAGKVTLGRSGRFSVIAGMVKTMNVPVSASGRRRLRRHPKGTTVTVKVMKTDGRVWTNGEGGRVRP